MKQKSKFRTRPKPALAVGGKVYVQFGKKKRTARIVEDRGRIGREGQRLLRVELTQPGGLTEQVFEVPADMVTRVQTRRRLIRKTKPNAA